LPKRTHHLDRRASLLIDEGAGDPDQLIDTKQLAAWLQCSEQKLEIDRHKGDGPPYVKISPKMVRYRRGDVIAWLRSRIHLRIAEVTG
jgi:predicted DNA-binding transcriptional regulator AlpA